MSRPLRIQYPHAVYHVTARGNERKAIVRNDDDRMLFVRVLSEMVDQHKVILHAWVLMDNHYHLLIETPHSNISQSIRHLNGVYTQTFNRRHERAGHLFQGRFKSVLVEKETYLLELCRYIILNPIRAGMVKDASEWPWSSYGATAGEAPPPGWQSVAWILSQFGKQRKRAQKAYRQFVSEGTGKQKQPWPELRGQIYLGREAFVKEIQNQQKQEEGEDAEIPLIQRHPVHPDIDVILKNLSKVYQESVEQIIKPTWRPSEARQLGIYLARRVSGLGLKQIAERFGIGYTGVSRRVSAVAKRIKEEKTLRDKIRLIANDKIKT